MGRALSDTWMSTSVWLSSFVEYFLFFLHLPRGPARRCRAPRHRGVAITAGRGTELEEGGGLGRECARY